MIIYLLSSITLFIFSTQSASTGPSKITHCLLFASGVYTNCLSIFDAKPSVQVCVKGSKFPYNSSIDIDLGFKTLNSICVKSGLLRPLSYKLF